MSLYVHTLRSVYAVKSSWVITLVVTWFMVTVAIWFSNLSLLWWMWTNIDTTIIQKITFFLAGYTSLGTNFTLLGAISLVLAALLTGIVLACLHRYIEMMKSPSYGIEAGSWSFSGVVSTFLGIGCASCGSVVITSIIGVAGASAFLSRLPLHGVEFSVLAILIQLATLRFLLKKMTDPRVC